MAQSVEFRSSVLGDKYWEVAVEIMTMPPQMSQILSHLESQSELVGTSMREVVERWLRSLETFV